MKSQKDVKNLNKNSIEYRVYTGELPSPEDVKKYYLDEDHTYNDSMEHFGMSRKTWINYTNKYDIKKGIDPCQENRLEKEKREEEQKIEEEKQKELIKEEAKPRMAINEDDEDPEVSNQKKNERYGILYSNYDGDHKKAMFQFCYEYNIFFDNYLVDVFIDRDSSKLPLSYVNEIMNSDRYKEKTFFSQIKQENFEKIYSEDLLQLYLSEEVLRNRKQCIEIMGDDPFKNPKFIEKNLKYLPKLYRDLTEMLSDGNGMRMPKAKKEAAVQIVNNYLSIEKYREQLTELTDQGTFDDETQKKIDQCQTIISKIQTSINQTSKENGFSGGKVIGSNGHGTLSDVMKMVDEKNYDPGVANFYDIATSKAIRDVSDISFKALFHQVKLQDSDYADIVAQQAKLVRDSQMMARKAQEEVRLIKEKIIKQELIDELEKELEQKKIDDAEIQDFASLSFEDLVEKNKRELQDEEE